MDFFVFAKTSFCGKNTSLFLAKTQKHTKIAMRKVLLVVSILVFIVNVFPQNPTGTSQPIQQSSFKLDEYGVSIEPEKRLIIVKAALEYGGIQTDLSERGKEFSQKINSDLGGGNEELKARIKRFYDGYKSRQPADATTGQLIAPFVSLAYALTEDLTAPAKTDELPADLLEVLDFASIARDFHAKTNFESKLPGYLKLYREEGDKMKQSISEMVGDLLAYLNTRPQLVTFSKEKVEVADPKNPKKKVQGIKTIEHERHFYIVPDLLATAGTVNFRNIGDNYYAIVPPNTNFAVSEVRRAFLQFVLDPLVLKYAGELSNHRPQIKGLLDERRKSNPNVSPDIFLAVTRSLVAAADAKEIEFNRVRFATDTARRKIDFAQTDTAKKAISTQLAKDKQDFADETASDLADAYERGSVLSFYFAEQLKGSEDSGFSIDGLIRDMIISIDAGKEKDRLTQTAQSRQRTVAIREERRKNASSVNAQNEQNIARAKALKEKLDPIEELIKKKEFDEATSTLKSLLADFPGESNIYYVLGRVASVSASSLEDGGTGTFDEELRDKRLEDALVNFQNAINSATPTTDPVLIQLSYFSIGRIYEFWDRDSLALENYRKAAAVGNFGSTAYRDSMAGINRLSAPKPQ